MSVEGQYYVDPNGVPVFGPPFNCPKCPKTFDNRSSIVRHLRRVHNRSDLYSNLIRFAFYDSGIIYQ